MTATATQRRVGNPYLDEFNAIGGSRWSENTYGKRTDLVRQYAWAVPTINALRRIEECGPIVEIGAGTGYWAYLLRERGVDVIAYDLWPAAKGDINRYHPNVTCWTEVLKGNVVAAGKHPDRTLMLCWPPYDDEMATQAVKCHANAGGKRVVYIGESDGGCTGDDAFHALLRAEYREVGEVAIPQWEGIHDYLWVYERKTSTALSERVEDSGTIGGGF